MVRRRDYTVVNSESNRRRLPDGATETVVYFYRRACGTFLGRSDKGMTKAQAAEVVRQWEEEAGQSGPAAGSVDHLFTKYRDSPHFKYELSDKTRHEYRLEMARLERSIGHRQVASIRKSDVMAIRDARQNTPYGANATLRTLSAIFTWGVANLSHVERNPVRDVPLLPTRPGDAVWFAEQREAFMESAGPHLRRGFATLLYTVQRTTDMLRLRTAQVFQVRGRDWINLRQTKTDSLVAVPIHGKFAEVYERNPVPGAFLCPAPDGAQWTYDSFARAWDANVRRTNLRLARRAMRDNPLLDRSRKKDREMAKLEIRKRLIVGLQRRDLRRTGMLELALCGVLEAQIASLSGHSIEQTRRILDTYLPRRGELALAAVERWEANEGKVLALHLLPPQRSLEEVTEQAPNGSANRTANRRATANRKSGVSA